MNIATIRTGPIVGNFLSAISDVEDVQCIAMFSRKEEKAKQLAETYKISSIYTHLDDMLDDPTIEFVYVASPNSLHYEHTYQSLQKGKHVICEKPFTSTAKELESLMELAIRKKLLLFEAITTIHLPNYKLMKEHIAKLGQIKFIQCNYSQYSSRYDLFLAGETPNTFNPHFSGGALMDINIYNLHFVMNLFGKPESVNYIANKHPNGIDTSGILILKYPDFICELVGCKDSRSMNFAMIQGEKGYLHVENDVNKCEKIIFHLADQELVLDKQTNTNRLYYEIEVFSSIFKKKDYHQCYKLLDYSLKVIQTMEEARKSADIIFSADKK